jgi:hypothetical protein
VPGFSLGLYVFKDAEIVDFAAPHGVISVARRFDAELDAFLIMGLLDGLAATNRKEPDRAESRHGLGDGDGGGSASEERPYRGVGDSRGSSANRGNDSGMGQV